MKRVTVLAVLALGLTAGLAACGDDSKDNDNGSGSTGEVTLSVWGPKEDQANASSWLQTQEAAFEKAHPEWKITWKNSVVSEGDAATTVKQDTSAAADVYMFANDQLGNLVEASAIGVVPANVLSQVQEQNEDIMITSVTGADGKVYGVPFTANTWFMYYDKSVFTEEDVKSLDAMLAKGKVAFPLDTAWYLPSFYIGNGCTLYGPEGTDEAAGVDFSGAKAADVTAYLVGLVANPNFVVDSNGAGLAGIQNKTINAYFSGSWDGAAVQEALGDNFGAAQLPTFTLGGQQVQMKSFAGSKAIAFNPNAKNAQAAAAFAAFLGSTEAQKAHYDMRGIIPTDKSLASDSAVAADPVALAQIDTVAATSVFQPTVPAMGNFWTPTENFGKALVSKEVTAANAAEQTEAWNSSLNAGS
ncbi:MAG: extracellular solute-binding protein [Bifidobacteriaceae bacterium]|jgi:arabinogalactan oligomer/maltooligosaccharide transport system substrate-binding protein|nr:extracellular solute-binding protein [Bifidobacteriaceae bacterium]